MLLNVWRNFDNRLVVLEITDVTSKCVKGENTVAVVVVTVSPTNINQYNLPAGSNSMSRSNSIPAQDSFDLYGEGHPLGGSANSLEERPRAISRSGSFRDSTDEGRTQTHVTQVPSTTFLLKHI